jgi:hypothetical protein
MTVGIIKISHEPIYKWSQNQFVDTTKLSIILQKASGLIVGGSYYN